jgi:hypothetical protein
MAPPFRILAGRNAQRRSHPLGMVLLRLGAVNVAGDAAERVPRSTGRVPLRLALALQSSAIHASAVHTRAFRRMRRAALLQADDARPGGRALGRLPGARRMGAMGAMGAAAHPSQQRIFPRAGARARPRRHCRERSSASRAVAAGAPAGRGRPPAPPNKGATNVHAVGIAGYAGPGCVPQELDGGLAVFDRILSTRNRTVRLVNDRGWRKHCRSPASAILPLRCIPWARRWTRTPTFCCC